MLLYVAIAILSYILLNLSKKVKTGTKKNVLIFISFFLLFLVSAFRVNVGTDYNSYRQWFLDINGLSFSYVNFLFNNLIYIIKLFTNNPQYFFAVTSFLILSIIYLATIKDNEEYDMSLFLFIVLGFYFATFNGIRQWISIAIFVLAYRLAIKKDWLKYIFLILVASLFHISAILLLPFYFIFNIRIKDRIKIIIVFVTLFIFKFFSFDTIISFFLKNFAIEFYWRYISSGVDLTQGVGSPFPIIICGGMMFFYMLFRDMLLKKMPKDLYERNKHMCFILTLFSIVNTVNNLFSRFAAYFIPMIILFLPDFFQIFDNKWKKIMKIVIIFGGIAFLIINTLLKNSNNPLPYTSIFG